MKINTLGILIGIISGIAIIITNELNYRFGFITMVLSYSGLLVYFKMKGGKKK